MRAVSVYTTEWWSAGPCGPGAMQCSSAATCIPQRSWCNGHTDCPGGEDEDSVGCGQWVVSGSSPSQVASYSFFFIFKVCLLFFISLSADWSGSDGVLHTVLGALTSPRTPSARKVCGEPNKRLMTSHAITLRYRSRPCRKVHSRSRRFLSVAEVVVDACDFETNL